MTDAPPRTTCYVSSPAHVDTGALRRLLADLGVEAIAPEDLPTAGQALAPVLMEGLRRTTFTCAVLAGPEQGNVLLEIGLALGLARPVFLLASGDGDVPLTLGRVPQVKAAPDEVDAIRFHLDAFVANLPRVARIAAIATPSGPPRSHAGRDEARGDPVDGNLAATSAQGTEANVVDEVAALLGEIASLPPRPVRVGDFEADLLVWPRDAEIGLGGPLLVEVKTGAREPLPARVERQVAHALRSTKLRAALVVTGAPDVGVSGKLVEGALVLSVSLAGLRREVGAGTLVQNMRRARNRLFHAAP